MKSVFVMAVSIVEIEDDNICSNACKYLDFKSRMCYLYHSSLNNVLGMTGDSYFVRCEDCIKGQRMYDALKRKSRIN